METSSSRFLKVFGKPDRLTTCECERTEEPGILQAFQMLTGELLTEMLKAPHNRIGQFLQAGLSDEAMLHQFYLASIARRPTTTEQTQLLAYLSQAKDRRAAWEDIVWSLVNSKEFLLRR
jgi:hypothetical protein